ncbi:MAG: regulatory protein RecX [Coriobacteriia bacterium]
MEARNEVTAIRSRRGSKRREVELDGSMWRAMPRSVLAELGISSGDLVDPDENTARMITHEPPAARERALRLLAYRDRSESEMRTRLSDDGYSPLIVDQIVGWLLDTGLLDDGRFAEQLARTLVIGRRYGRSRALQYMRRAGVSDELALSALGALAPSEDERDRALALARSLFRSGDTVDRLASRLVRRGFTPADSLACARLVIGESEPPEGDFF